MIISKQTLQELKDQDYPSLESYLEYLAEEYSCDIEEIEALAEMLGESELFDGLISALDDHFN